MKKIVILFIIAVLALAMVGCGGGDKKTGGGGESISGRRLYH